MRKSVMIGLGVTATAVLAVAGIASASTTHTSRSGTTNLANVASNTTISQADAERIALAQVPGSTVTETRLDTDNGRSVWNVHLSTPNGAVEIKVDSQTGAVRVDDNGGQPSTTPSAGDDNGRDDSDGSDDGPGHDMGDDNGTDGPGHDMGDDHGHGGGSGSGSDDGPSHS